MKNDLNTTNLTPSELAQIEARARILRAEAARDGFVSVRNAIAHGFSSLFLRGSKAA